jgi:UDP-N-acetylglucosamine--N-acetylmuramyl-(pentapeptide) pyrophosphoryl-undecaprenol N-acetylglucosamine transferase
LEGKTVEVAMTLREAFLQPLPTKEEACSFYGLDPQLPTFLIFGGSQGAQRLNELALQLVEELKKEGNPVQILHFIGPRADAAALESLYRVLCPDPQWKFVVRSFEPRMEMSWAAADLAICRSGATTLAEQIHMCVPSILIPFPSAADGHQEKNAEFMAQQVQGALMIKEEQATGQKLKQMVKELLAQQGLRLKAMKQRLCEHKQRPLCKDMSTLIVEMLADLK